MKLKTGISYPSKTTGKDEELVVSSKKPDRKWDMAIGGLFTASVAWCAYSFAKYFYHRGAWDGMEKLTEVCYDVKLDEKNSEEKDADSQTNIIKF